MRVKDQIGVADAEALGGISGEALLRPLVANPSTRTASASSLAGVVIGELMAITNDGRTPLVVFPGQRDSVPAAARTTIDLHGEHIGGQVVLVFEDADAAKPVVIGVLRDEGRASLGSTPGTVELDADGERLVVTAKQELVLRCGKASIRLTRAGKVLIEGAYISSRSSGVNRIKGGSVQLN